jgi:hypothetical protein
MNISTLVQELSQIKEIFLKNSIASSAFWYMRQTMFSATQTGGNVAFILFVSPSALCKLHALQGES